MRNNYIIFGLSLLLLSLIALHHIGRSSCRTKLNYIEVGAPINSANSQWVYLGGLLADTKYINELNDTKTLDRIGKELGITYIIPFQQHRCASLGNKLCWPSDSPYELWQTYNEITAIIGTRPIAGYIGFSNGGFFLDLFAQQKELAVPIISIGAAGDIYAKTGPHNVIHLLISPQDTWHYQPALNFYTAANESNLKVTLHEYDGGHVVPYQLLKDILLQYSRN